MVPSWSAALSSIYSTTLMAVGRHLSVRSTETAFLCMGLGSHVLVLQFCWPRLCCVNHISHIQQAVRPARISSVSLVSRLGRMAHLACMKCATHRMPLVIPLRLQLVREDHF